jgi:hypothetical protein
VGSTISSHNVSTLAEAWTFKLPGKGATTIQHYEPGDARLLHERMAPRTVDRFHVDGGDAHSCV